MTPVKDEVLTIGRTIRSVVRQTVVPQEWVIVSDGSRDGTDRVIEEAAEHHDWIRLVAVESAPERSFAAVVRNTEAGVEALRLKRYKYLGLIDADVEFQPTYFERLISRFEADPRLGLVGGVVIDVDRPQTRFPRNLRDVPGATQFFRKECFESLGGLAPIPEGGWDGVACATARMNGYETRLFTDLVVTHLKPRNISQGGTLRRVWQIGVRDYAVGYDPIFEAVKCASRLTDAPFLIGAAASFVGYIGAAVRAEPRVVARDVVSHIRREQRERVRMTLTGLFRWMAKSHVA